MEENDSVFMKRHQYKANHIACPSSSGGYDLDILHISYQFGFVKFS